MTLLKNRVYFSSLWTWPRSCDLMCQWAIRKWDISRILRSSCTLGFSFSCKSFYHLNKPGLPYWMMRDLTHPSQPCLVFVIFLNLWVCSFHHVWNNFSHYFTNYLFCPHSLLELQITFKATWNLSMAQWGSVHFFSAFILSSFLIG